MPTVAHCFTHLLRADTVSAVLAAFAQQTGGGAAGTRIVQRGAQQITLDNDADFVSAYASGIDWALTRSTSGVAALCLAFDGAAETTFVSVQLPDRAGMARVVQALGHHAPSAPLPATSLAPPTVFIGHGQDHQWRELADHLRELHGIRVLVYESAPRAGLSNDSVLAALAREADFALLVHTGDRVDESGTAFPSDNVIHETGLFQGILGAARAIVVREEGCTTFANMAGINELRFRPGNIASVFGDAIAVLRREFPYGAAVHRDEPDSGR